MYRIKPQTWPAMDEDLLGIMQMSDSMFPAGVFAMSHGIESMHLAGDMATAEDLEGMLRSCLEHQIGPSDCSAAAQAHRHAVRGDISGILELDARYMATKSVREARDASARSGTQMITCITEILDDETALRYTAQIRGGGASGSYPVSFGVCCRAMGVSEYGTALALAYGFVAGSVGAALRLGIIQHVEAQHAIRSLKLDMERAAHTGCESDILWQFCPQAEIMQMSHEELDSKMFIT